MARHRPRRIAPARRRTRAPLPVPRGQLAELGPFSVRPIFIVAGLAVLALAFWRRNDIRWAGGKVMDAAKQGIFKAILEPHVRPYGDVILRVAGEQGVDPFVIVALGERESGWGTQLSADMTGDHTPRDPAAWKYAMPPDGGGWGRGIMQVDYFRSVAERHNWRDAYANVTLGVKIYKEKIRELLAAPSGNWSISDDVADQLGVAPGVYRAVAVPQALVGTAALAAYNAGSANVRRAYSAGGAAAIDRTTTGGDYSAWTSRVLASLTQRFVAAGGATA